MKIRHFLMTLLALGTLCSGCVDPAFNLDDIKLEGVVFKNLEVPIGSFEELTLNTILQAQGAEMRPLAPGVYALEGSAVLSGISLKFEDDLYFKEAELHTVILNTIPLDMSFSATALDAEGQVCQDVKVTILADKTPMIASGKKGSPSSNPVVIRLECGSRYTTLDGLRLDFSGRTGAGFEGEAPQGDEGITLTQVSLKMPEGFSVSR